MVKTSERAKMTRREKYIVTILLGAQFMLAVDFSILNVALPDIGESLKFTVTGLAWVVTIFSLMAAGLTLFFGRVADMFGRRKLFQTGLVILGIGSLIGGVATTPELLLFGRALQGVATAIVTPAALALLTTTFAEGPLRDRALGLNGALLAAGFTTGSVLGGILTSAISWRWAFLVNLPVVLIILFISTVVLKESRHPARPRLDVGGAVTITAGLFLTIFGVTRLGEAGLTDLLAYGYLLPAALFFMSFAAIEKRVRHPLVSLNMLRRRDIRWGNIAGLVAFATETSLVYVTTLYLQDLLELSAFATGMTFTSIGVATFLGGLFGARIIEKIGSKKTLVYSLTVQGIATIALVALMNDVAWLPYILVMTAIGGFANMLAIVAFMVTATSGVSNERQGEATAIASMSQLIGISVGIPVMGALFSYFAGTLITIEPELFLNGYHVAVVTNGVICIILGVLLLARLKPKITKVKV